MNIKKKEVVVTAFEENPLWKLIISPHNRPSSLDSTTKTFTTNATSGGTTEDDEEHEDVYEGGMPFDTSEPEAETKVPCPPSEKVPALRISLLKTPDVEDH